MIILENQFVKFEIREQAGILSFNAPERLNALNSKALKEMKMELVRIEKEELDRIRVLILTGEGKSFIAGADISEMANLCSEEAAAFARKGMAVMNQISDFPLPVIAAVNGFALGGGLETALACDFIYASDKARLGLPEATLGIIPGFGGNRRLIDRIGLSHAKELIYTGRIISAQEALKLGLVNRVFDAGSLVDEAIKTSVEIARTSPHSIEVSKKLLKACSICAAEEVDYLEETQFSQLFDHPDQREGMSAFISKRKPQWSTVK